MAIEWADSNEPASSVLDEHKRFCTVCFSWVSASRLFSFTSEAWSMAACGECWDKWVARKGKRKRVRHPRRGI